MERGLLCSSRVCLGRGLAFGPHVPNSSRWGAAASGTNSVSRQGARRRQYVGRRGVPPMETPKKSLQAELEAIEERALDEEVDRLLALSDAELDLELENAELNPEEGRAGAIEILEKAMRLPVT